MAFTLDSFVAVRPYLFHLTAQGNLNRILATHVLEPAATLMKIGGWNAPRVAPRRSHQSVEIDGYVVWVRDQHPLHEKNIGFEDGWNLPRFLAHIDQHVFFWPGKEDGPIKAARNHFER